jgi:hypothetical protein
LPVTALRFTVIVVFAIENPLGVSPVRWLRSFLTVECSKHPPVRGALLTYRNDCNHKRCNAYKSNPSITGDLHRNGANLVLSCGFLVLS